MINVGSGGLYGRSLPAGDPQSERTRYGPKRIYARTKRQQEVITEQWAERLAGTGIVVHAMHPGWVDTKGVREWLPVFRVVTRPIIRGPEQGADTIVWLGAAPEPLRCTRPTHYRLGAGEDSEAARRELWETCERLVHQDAAREHTAGHVDR